MKMVPALICTLSLLIFALPAAIAQSEKQTGSNTTEGKHASGLYTPSANNTERKAIMDVLRKEVKGWSGLDVIFVVNYLKINQGWAWIETFPQSRDGRNRYEGVSGLLHKTKGQWKMVETRPCCGECADDPNCSDDKRYFKKLKSKSPTQVGLPLQEVNF